MTKRVANRDIPAIAKSFPDFEIEGYGAMSYTPRGYWTGHLPYRLAALYGDVIRRQRFVPTIYSYGTPIAWFDARYNVWVRPDVSYSITTAKHQGYLWQLSYGYDPGNYPTIYIPRDCGFEEYTRYVTQKMVYTRTGTAPGPNYVPGK